MKERKITFVIIYNYNSFVRRSTHAETKNQITLRTCRIYENRTVRIFEEFSLVEKSVVRVQCLDLQLQTQDQDRSVFMMSGIEAER